MTHVERPTQISFILQTIDHQIGAEIDGYIAHLEAHQRARPDRIAALLDDIRSRYPTDMSASLEAYISGLEANQQVVLSKGSGTSTFESGNPPVWSYQHSVRREHHRRERAQRKQDSFR